MDLDCVTRDHEFFFDLVIFVLLGGAVVLKGARLSDSGVIKCVASNILGRCTSTAQFSIEGMNNLLQSNLAIRNFLVITKLFTNAQGGEYQKRFRQSVSA